jgi:uridine kinase
MTPDREAVFAEITASLLEQPSPERAQVVGISGVDTSGKSFFARAFAAYLEQQDVKHILVHLDDFHNPRQIRYQNPDPIQSYFKYAFNLNLLEIAILAPLKQGETVDVTLSLLDLATDTRTRQKRYHIDRETLVVLEGVLLFRPPIDTYVDCRVSLHVTFDEVLRRARARDVPRYGPDFLKRYREKYIPIQKRYLAEHHPLERSHFVIDNTDYLHPEIIARHPLTD